MLDGLNHRFALDDRLVFTLHPSGLVQGVVHTALCRGLFFLHGAHVAEFCPHEKEPVLFMSGSSVFEAGKPIRGGVPLCFPWFGPRAGDSTAPAHGLVRTQNWELQSTAADAAGVIQVVLGLEVDQWQLRYTVRFGTELDLTLMIENLADQPRECDVALHTYFALADAEHASVHGLEHHPHLDKLTGEQAEPSGGPIRFTQETDRIYWGPAEEVVVHDPGHHRDIYLNPRNSHSTVVWNPWVDKSQRMPDFGDHEFKRMCCVETANVGEQRLNLSRNSAVQMGVAIGQRDHL